jgi:hypothetical protein
VIGEPTCASSLRGLVRWGEEGLLFSLPMSPASSALVPRGGSGAGVLTLGPRRRLSRRVGAGVGAGASDLVEVRTGSGLLPLLRPVLARQRSSLAMRSSDVLGPGSDSSPG